MGRGGRRTYFSNLWCDPTKGNTKLQNEISQERRLKRMSSKWSKLCFCKKSLEETSSNTIPKYKRALTLKQYRLLLYHQAIRQYITYEQNWFICTGPLILEQYDITLVIASWCSKTGYCFSVRPRLSEIRLGNGK